jgi:tetratricopeptide (TPR) repeat protein
MVHDLGVGPKVRDENRPLAKKLLEEAIARDPKFVLAYCLLSEVQATARYWAEKPTPEQLATAKATAETAVRLAPDSAQAHLALAGVYYALEDQKRGIEEIEVAARAMPNSAEVAGALGDVAINRGQWKEALQHLQKAVQLDPRDPETALALIGYYIDLRWYDEAEQLTERTMAALPPATAREFWARKFYINVGRADLKAAMSALEQSPDHITSASTSYNHHIADILIMERRYADGEKRILEIPERAIKGNTVPGSGINPYARGFYALRLGIAYRAEGKQQEAREAFENSRQGFLGWLNEHPEEAMALALLAVTDAGCGRKEDSMREAQKALDTWPMSREPLPAINLRAEVALAYAWNGERDRAIELLQSIVKLPGGPTGGRLQLDPAWDDLQNDPRFKQLILEARKPVDLEHLHDSSTKN